MNDCVDTCAPTAKIEKEDDDSVSHAGSAADKAEDEEKKSSEDGTQGEKGEGERKESITQVSIAKPGMGGSHTPHMDHVYVSCLCYSRPTF